VAGLDIINLDAARYECVYPECGGICCKHPRPAVESDEQQNLAASMDKILPRLRPEAQDYLSRNPFTTLRKKDGLPTLAVVDHWCVFFNGGCTLHTLGASEGDRWKYKPWRCIAFPLDRDQNGNWYVRQHGTNDEAWDLFCLNPAQSPKPARDTLGPEMAIIAKVEERYFSHKAVPAASSTLLRFDPAETVAPANNGDGAPTKCPAANI